MIEQRDSYTAGHTKRVALYATKIAKEMKYNDEDIELLYRASMLHDIGKISTPDSILLKPGKLNELEYNLIQEHVSVSYDLLKNVDIYKDIAEIVRHHHEYYDGSGYPNALKDSEITMLSHIMALADSFDAMTTDRIYKGRKTVDIALYELEQLSNKQFHPKVVHAAKNALKDIVIDELISQVPKTKLEKERFSYFYRDLTTNAYNKEYLQFVLNYNGKREFFYQDIYIVYLHNFTQYNKETSWEDGNQLLVQVTDVLNDEFSDILVFRLYGDDFILLTKKNKTNIENHLEALTTILSDLCVTYSFKYVKNDDYAISDIQKLERLL